MSTIFFVKTMASADWVKGGGWKRETPLADASGVSRLMAV
jgi:hypothetical protein